MAELLPIGTPGGRLAGLAGVPDGIGLVRLGHDIMQLDPDRYRLWQLASAVPESAELIRWAAENGIGDAESRIRTMRDVGLVVTAGSDPAVLTSRLAIRLLGECVGNTSNGHSVARGMAAIVGRGGQQLSVNIALYELLLRSDGARSISYYCEQLERAQPALPRGKLAATALAGLPALVRSGSIRLDRAMP